MYPLMMQIKENVNYMALPGTVGFVFNATVGKPSYQKEDKSNDIKASSLCSRLSSFFSVSEMNIESSSRKPQYVFPRHLLFYILSKYHRQTLNQLAAKFKLHHTTILHGINRIKFSLLIEAGEEKKLIEQFLLSYNYSLPKNES